MLEKLRALNKRIGMKQCTKAINEGMGKKIVMASDADERLTQHFIRLCEEKGLEIVYVQSMKQLGKACGIDVSASVVCILD